MNTSIKEEERHTLEMIDGSYPVQDEREEQLWRGFMDMFARNHAMSELFTFDEITAAYHAYLRALLNIAAAARLDN
jgi:hypothetical protein